MAAIGIVSKIQTGTDSATPLIPALLALVIAALASLTRNSKWRVISLSLLIALTLLLALGTASAVPAILAGTGGVSITASNIARGLSLLISVFLLFLSIRCLRRREGFIRSKK